MIQLINVFEENTILENLDMERLAAHLKINDVKVQSCYINKGKKDQYSRINLSDKLFGFTVNQNTVLTVYEIVNWIKTHNEDSIVFLFGRIPSLYADIFLDENKKIDFIILGDPEIPITDYIKKFKMGYNVRRDCHFNSIISQFSRNNKTSYCSDINHLPWPDRTNLKSMKSIYAKIYDSSGCDGICSFCVMKGVKAHISYRSAKDIMDEIIYIYNFTKIKAFTFVSASLELPGIKGKEKIKELCLLLKDYPVKFSLRCYLKANSFTDYSDKLLLKLMKECGFTCAFIGIESGDVNDLALYNKKNTIENNVDILNLMDNVGIYAGDYGFIMFNPYSSFDSLQNNFQFLVKNNCEHLHKYISLLRIHYNTDIYFKTKNDHLLLRDYKYLDETLYRVKDINVNDIFNFICLKLRTSKIFQLEKHFYDFSSLYYFFHNLIDLSDMKNTLEWYEKLLSCYFKEYFENIYCKNDLIISERLLCEFENKVCDIYNKCKSYSSLMVLRYYRDKGVF